MQNSLPSLIISVRGVPAAVTLNNEVVGEVSPASRLSLPLSDNGVYYIGILPLAGGYMPITRRLEFQGGILRGAGTEGMEAYAWAGGTVEAVFMPPATSVGQPPLFPFTLDQLRLSENQVATLYYENGWLNLALEEGAKIRYGEVLGAYTEGRLQRHADGALCVIAGNCALPAGEAPEGYGRLLVVILGARRVLRLEADAVGREGRLAVSFERLPTLLGHDRKRVYGKENDAAYRLQTESIGFFTHAPQTAKPGREVLRAFIEAAQYGQWEEALSYLTPGLREGLDEAFLKEYIGPFSGYREPLYEKDSQIGLLGEPENGVYPVRMVRFQFVGGLIDNLEEE